MECSELTKEDLNVLTKNLQGMLCQFKITRADAAGIRNHHSVHLHERRNGTMALGTPSDRNRSVTE